MYIKYLKEQIREYLILLAKFRDQLAQLDHAFKETKSSYHKLLNYTKYNRSYKIPCFLVSHCTVLIADINLLFISKDMLLIYLYQLKYKNEIIKYIYLYDDFFNEFYLSSRLEYKNVNKEHEKQKWSTNDFTPVFLKKSDNELLKSKQSNLLRIHRKGRYRKISLLSNMNTKDIGFRHFSDNYIKNLWEIYNPKRMTWIKLRIYDFKRKARRSSISRYSYEFKMIKRLFSIWRKARK